jgi:uncharacterized damage-inducible protein DinB
VVQQNYETICPRSVREPCVIGELDHPRRAVFGKYSWRPAKGVRSASEVYMHVFGTNYFVGGPIGVKPPSGFNFHMEKTVTDKAKVMEALRGSFAQIRQAVMNLSDADLSKPTTSEGQQTTYEGLLFFLAAHTHEHLGQLIAYARSNGIVPPWSKD